MNIEQNVIQVPIEMIIPNRFQPRLTFEDRGLEELANSIKEHGIIQPLVLRRVEDKFEIIAGERRYKAATLAGLTKVPAIIADMDDNKSAEVAIVENVQRRDLTPIEEARSYKNLLDKGYLTQAELARKMGLSQSAIANKLRLLNLDETVQEALLNNEISERHARSLLTLDSFEEQRKWLGRIIKERMPVRKLDDELKKYIDSKNAPAKEEIPEEEDIPLVKNPNLDDIINQASELPSIDGESEIARRLREIEREKMYNPDVIPVEQATNKSKGNFFNFLEEETVNMNTEERDLKTPAIELPTLSEENPKPENKSNFEPSFNFGSNNTNSSASFSEDTEDDSNFDPINLIDTLDPSYEAKVEEKLGVDLKTAISDIRNIKDSLSDKGFNISLEESDTNDFYQFVIKVKKD